MPILEFRLRLGAALFMGAMVGLERQWRQRMAGTRANVLVSAGAAAFDRFTAITRPAAVDGRGPAP
jgi:uncharacterized membrane protein YhiD involved in acid resistance